MINFPKLNQILDILSVLHLIDSRNHKLKDSGDNFRAYCPVHQGDKQQSLAINKNDKTWFCHSCSAEGRDLISLYAQSKRISQYEAGLVLKNHFNINDTTLHNTNFKRESTPIVKSPETDIEFAVWDKASDEGDHSYFKNKQVIACTGLRYGTYEFDNQPSILIPFKNVNGQLRAIGYIKEDHTKPFAKGSKTSGAFFVVNNQDHVQAKKAYIAEGLATALTIHKAIKFDEPNSIVISCGSLGNMLPTIKSLRLKYKNIKLIACPDQGEAGRTVTQKILQQNISNLKIIMPKFDGLQANDKDTDFNDLQNLVGIETVKQQLQDNMPQVQSTTIKPAIETKPFEQTLTTQEKIVRPVTSTDSNDLSYLLAPNSEEKLTADIKSISKGISTGYTIGDIDLIFPGGAISVIAAPTSHGKTTALINFCLSAIDKNPETNAYFFSYEESEASILVSFLNTYISKRHPVADIIEPLSKNNKRSIESFYRDDKAEFINNKLIGTFTTSKNCFFKELIDTKRLKIIYSEVSIEQLVKSIEFIKKNDPKVGIICIDYIQLLRLSTSKLSRQEQVKEICTQLKNCAIKTGLPIVTAAQFNRTVTSEGNMSVVSIGEAGDIERIASLVIGMFNRNFKNMDKEGNKDRSGDTIDEKDTIYFEVLKGRNVGVGHNTVMNFNGNAGTLFNKKVQEVDKF